jgi:AcrR family transcriptional regulator
VRCSHRQYVRRRAREIAYGRWDPWADADVVRRHLERLRVVGVSYDAIASVAGVSPMTVHRLHRGKPRAGERRRSGPQPTARVSAATAQRLLAVTPAMVEQVAARRDATGARRRLQALIALGHPVASLARRLGIAPRRVSSLVYETTATVTPCVHAAVCGLYDQLWDVPPSERTLAERKAAAAARALAANWGWPTPMGLDDDQIDDPAYRPRAHWRPITGSETRGRHQGQLSTGESSRGELSTADGRRALGRRSRCQAASARHPSGGHS